MDANPTILQMKYARIIQEIALMQHISKEQAMEIFYQSKTFQLISTGVADLHCRSDLYLAEEIIREYKEKM